MRTLGNTIITVYECKALLTRKRTLSNGDGTCTIELSLCVILDNLITTLTLEI